MGLIDYISKNIKIFHKVRTVPVASSKEGFHFMWSSSRRGLWVVSSGTVYKIVDTEDFYSRSASDTLMQNQRNVIESGYRQADTGLQTQIDNLLPINTKKSYTTKAAADANNNPTGDDGQPILLGQIVVVISDPDPAKNGIYRLKSLGAGGVPLWEWIGSVGDVTLVSEKIDALSDGITQDLSMPVYDGTNEENDYSALIGIWRNGYMTSNPTSYIRENVNGYLELQIKASVAADIAFVTTKKIDLTGLKSIEIEMESIGSGSTDNLRTRVNIGQAYTEPWSSGTSIGILYREGNFARQTFNINVANRTGLHYLQIFASKNTTSSSFWPHLKIYSVKFISKNQSTVDVSKSVTSLIPGHFQFCMGWGSASASIQHVTVSESAGMITFPTSYRIADRQGNQYTGIGGKSVSAICTYYDTGNPVESSFGMLIFNKQTNELRNIYWNDWVKINDDWLTLGVVKRSSASTSVIGNVFFNTLLSWEYENATSADISKDVVARNISVQGAVNAAIYNKYYDSIGGKRKRFNFLHFTDNHGDTIRTGNIVKYLNNTPELDMAILTGDILASDFTNSKAVVAQLAASGKPILPLLGNHDVGNSYEVAKCGNHEQVFNSLIKPFNDKEWISAGGKNYYFKDFAAQKIRVIALYEYDEPLDLNPADPSLYRIYRGRRVLGQEQIDWFTGTLLSTPSDYHLIVLTHQVPNGPGSMIEMNRDWNTYNSGTNQAQNAINGNLIPELIDAWQKGSYINRSYTHLDEAAYLADVNVVADFSERGEGAFVGYFFGHHHQDLLGTLENYPDQNVFSCVCTILDGASNRNNDLPRAANTKSEDAFNIITVGTSERKVYIVRVGADFTRDLKKRETLVVSY